MAVAPRISQWSKLAFGTLFFYKLTWGKGIHHYCCFYNELTYLCWTFKTKWMGLGLDGSSMLRTPLCGANDNNKNPQPLPLLWRVLGLSRWLFLHKIAKPMKMWTFIYLSKVLICRHGKLSGTVKVRYDMQRKAWHDMLEMWCDKTSWWSESELLLLLLLLLLRQEMESTRGRALHILFHFHCSPTIAFLYF